MCTDEPIPEVIRTELTVLKGDDGEARKLGWEIKEYDGVPLFRGPDGMTADEVLDQGLPEGFVFEPIPAVEELQMGDVVMYAAMMGGYHVATIGTQRVRMRDSSHKTEFIAKSRGGHVGFLRCGGDDRECWICWGGGNVDALMRLEIKR